jgi:fucose permease
VFLAIGFALFLPLLGRFNATDSISISLELVVWLVPSFIGGAVAVSLIGVLLGPIYPIVMNESGRILPRWLLTGCIGWIAGLGQTGSAALPFLTGAIASKTGIKSLQPL